MRKRQQRASATAGQQQAQQYYLVTPRHLAGGGDLRHVTEYLRASDWRDRSKTGGPIIFESPDRTVRVAYNPHTVPAGWTIRAKATAHQQAWRAVLSPHVPVEIVAGFSDALTTPRSAHAPNVWSPLQDHGWQAGRGHHTTAISPDGSAFVQFHQPASGEVRWWAGARTEQGQRAWDATFTSTTPMHLVLAFTTALADPLPVMRPRGHVPPDQRIRTTSVSVRPDEIAAWQRNRLALARAARVSATTARTGSTAPTIRPHTAGTSRPRR
ncbi:DUF317 domain-containing protein [Streptomyces sp. AK02-01A]|uniref:DUF317 domain-containing protein n=1 Tax=Streptomyces sp. AK02-01A TaxID=3028648 RepID=UPI0029B89DCA|nr:DUF317 domain-containing protein [Streptomyces sp. AK02-01A]MDX3855655.1 DUF317 domain-containing protein [Streptomyces sp. AK02-01A]